MRPWSCPKAVSIPLVACQLGTVDAEFETSDVPGGGRKKVAKRCDPVIEDYAAKPVKLDPMTCKKLKIQ